MAKKIKCPKCKSLNVQLMGNDKKGFSAGKALFGAAITMNPVGLAAGLIGKKGKYDFYCQDCGNRFQSK